MVAMTEAPAGETERAAAFEDFFHAHHERLLRVLYLSTGDRHEAEDLAQEAFVRVYERWARVAAAENPAGYLQREAVVLIEWLGMTDAQAGEALGVSPGAVRTRLHRARAALHETLRGDDDV